MISTKALSHCFRWVLGLVKYQINILITKPSKATQWFCLVSICSIIRINTDRLWVIGYFLYTRQENCEWFLLAETNGPLDQWGAVCTKLVQRIISFSKRSHKHVFDLAHRVLNLNCRLELAVCLLHGLPCWMQEQTQLSQKGAARCKWDLDRLLKHTLITQQLSFLIPSDPSWGVSLYFYPS